VGGALLAIATRYVLPQMTGMSKGEAGLCALGVMFVAVYWVSGCTPATDLVDTP